MLNIQILQSSICTNFSHLPPFPLSHFLLSLLVFYFLFPYQSDPYTKKWWGFDLTLTPHIWFRAVAPSEFMNFSRERICWRGSSFQACWKEFAVWLGSTPKQVSMYLAEEICELSQFIVQCMVIRVTFQIQFTRKPSSHVAVVTSNTFVLAPALFTQGLKYCLLEVLCFVFNH